MPEATTIPNITTVAPPNTGVGIIVAKAATLGIKPKKTRIPPAAITTFTVLTFDS